MKNVHFILLIPAIFLLYACSTLNTRVEVRENKLPARYTQHHTADTSCATVNWRNYFNDTLLEALIDTALMANQDMQIALNRIQTARAQVKFARGAQLPVVNANFNMSKRKFGFYTMDDAGNRVTEFAPGDTIPKHLPDYYTGLTTSWELDVWGRLKNQKKSAVENYLASLEGAHFATSVLVAEVALTYYELLAHDNALYVIQQTIAKQEEALAVIKEQKDAGRVNALAVQQFESRLLDSKALALEKEQSITETENRINLLLGRLPRPVNRSAEKLFDSNGNEVATGIPSDLLANRPDIKETAHLVEASKFDLKVAKAAFFPTFNITAALGYQAYATRFLFQTPASLAYNAMGGIISPVINRNAIKANFRTAKTYQVNAMYMYQKSIVNAYTEVVNELSYMQRINRISELKLQQKNILSTSVNMAQELYVTGRASYLEVLFTEQQLLDTELEVIETQKQKQAAAVRLYKALGGGWK